MSCFVCAIISSRSKESMEVLSNKQIYILLKILNDKKLQDGSANHIEFDKNFILKDFEHIQEQICTVESKTSDEIFTIEQTYMKMMGKDIHSGYKLSISDLDIIFDYANKYVEALIDESLTGLTPENNLSALLSEFYSTSNNTSLDNCTVENVKYMPVVLFAYMNNLIELKSITNRKYDLRKELSGVSLKDAAFNEAVDNVLDMIMRMNAIELFQNCDEYSKDCDPEKLKLLQYMQNFINTFSNKKTTAGEPKKTTQKPKEKYHMMPQQWKILFCLLKRAKEIGSRNGEGEIAKQIFVKNGIFTGKNLDGDTPVSRFNDDYNRIMGHKEKEEEMILYSKISDSNYFMFSLSKLRSFYNVIQKNDKLLEEYTKNRHFVAQIID